MVDVLRLQEATDEAVLDINALLPQLRSNPAGHQGTLSDLQGVIGDPSITMIVAKDGKRIIGMGFLYTVLKMGKRSGSIEDIVVDDSYRGKGVGKRIMNALTEAARNEKIQQLYLTTRADRIAAHKLYESLGFMQVQTDVFRLDL